MSAAVRNRRAESAESETRGDDVYMERTNPSEAATAAPRPRTAKLHWHVIRRVAVHAEADPRSVHRFCSGLPIRAGVGERIARALKAEGIEVVQP